MMSIMLDEAEVIQHFELSLQQPTTKESARIQEGKTPKCGRLHPARERRNEQISIKPG